MSRNLAGEPIAVLGAGAWGTALAGALAGSGRALTLWGRDEAVLDAIDRNRENPRYLPGITLASGIATTPSLSRAVEGAGIILVVTPAQSLADIVAGFAGLARRDAVVVSCAKGIDSRTGHTMTAIMNTALAEGSACVLSGPSFAVDVAAGLPTAVTVAASQMDDALALSAALSTPALRCYASDDIVGVEYGGALKNVLAIAAGIVFGRGLGASALAAVTTRGFAEMSRIARALGARPETLTGLSGLGDLILTCGSEKSRNFAYGAAIGRGDPLEGLKLAEGVHTAGIAAEICTRHGIEAPLVAAVSAILSGKVDVDETVTRLMSRPIKAETA